MAIRFLDEPKKSKIRFEDEPTGAPGAKVFDYPSAAKDWWKTVSGAGRSVAEPDISKPSRALRGVAVVASPFTGTLTAGMGAVERGLQETGVLPAASRINKALYDLFPDKAKRGLESLFAKLGGAAQKHPEAVGNIEAIANILGAVPAAGPTVKAGGKITEAAGKRILAGQLKVQKPLAKRVGGKAGQEAGKLKLIEDISKFDISSPRGFKGMSKRVDAEIKKQVSAAKQALKEASTKSPGEVINLDGNIAGYLDDLRAGTVKGVPFDQVEKAHNITYELMGKIKQQFGKDIDEAANLTIEQADKVRKMLSEKVFKKGAMQISDDPIRDQIKENLALRIRDAVAEYAPAQKVANRNIRDLINVRTALDDAIGRTTNWDKLGLTDWLVIGPSVAGGYATKSPGLAALGTAIVGAKKLGAGGRAGGAFMRAGKTLQKAPTIEDILAIMPRR